MRGAGWRWPRRLPFGLLTACYSGSPLLSLALFNRRIEHMAQPLSPEFRAYMAYIEDVEFLTAREGLYERLAELVAAREADGEPVGGVWIMETLRSLQDTAGIPARCLP